MLVRLLLSTYLHPHTTHLIGFPGMFWRKNLSKVTNLLISTITNSALFLSHSPNERILRKVTAKNICFLPKQHYEKCHILLNNSHEVLSDHSGIIYSKCLLNSKERQSLKSSEIIANILKITSNVHTWKDHNSDSWELPWPNFLPSPLFCINYPSKILSVPIVSPPAPAPPILISQIFPPVPSHRSSSYNHCRQIHPIRSLVHQQWRLGPMDPHYPSSRLNRGCQSVLGIFDKIDMPWIFHRLCGRIATIFLLMGTRGLLGRLPDPKLRHDMP